MFAPVSKLAVGLRLAFFCVMLATTAHAQTIVGRISGTVTDGTGAVVPNATVTVTDEATQQSRTVTTDDNGFYVITNLQPSSYSIAIESQGFKKSRKTG